MEFSRACSACPGNCALCFLGLQGLHDMAPETALDQCGVTSKQLVGLYECLTKAGRQVPAPLDLMLYTLKELKEMEIPARAEGDADVGPCVAVPFLEMQESYVLGRRTPALGPCQIYTEVLFKDIDLQALQAAVQRVAQAEPMLRATCQASGQMQEIREDLHWQLEVEEDSSLARARWSRPLPEGRFWALGASRCSGQVQLHLKVDMTFLDAESWLIVCCKVATGYRPTTSLPPSPDPSHEFFRYCATQQRGGLGEVEWKEKLKDLPLGPALPWCSRMGQGQAYAFGRVPLCVLREQWEDLKQHAKELGVSCTQLLITYFQDAIAFSSDASFTLTATVSRRPNHLKGCLGEFTNVALLSCNAESLQQERGVRAKNIQQQLLTQLAPGHITGMQIMRLWREIRREEVVLPVVLTSLLDLEHAQPISFGEERATVVYQRTQTPAVRLDVQFFEVQNELCVNFDYDERWLSEDVVKQLAKSFEEALAGEKLSVLHGGRLDTQAYNHSLLHELAFADLDAKKDLPALRSPQHTLSYDDLDRVTNYLANELTMIWNNQGVRSNFCDVRVAVALEKGWEQVVACLGVLRSGACYVPLELSDCRWKKVLSSADCSLALIKEGCDVRQETDTKCQCLEIGEVWLERARTAECKHIQAQPRGCDAAYIIFTSGTTGEPKGVVISHKSACNTCISVSHLLKLTKDDRVLALSNLNFDLSVYDIFGTLAAGACIVMCKQDDLKRYLNLCKVVSKEHVTIWNSVPLRFQLLVDEWCDSYFMPIRAALISGDAIQTSFARKVKRRFPALQFLALGGATEASIWSNFHEFTEASPDLPLVLYGKPLTNQQMYVLDSQMRIRPAYVPGEIFIGGSGVAKEYFRDQQRTAKSFLEHREYGRLYKTGDMGCYLPSGEIQIMGRLDQQVKVDGYRVELAEIEAAAHEILPKQVRVIVAAEKGQGVILRGFLCGQCPELNMAELKQMLQDGLKERLPIYMRPRTWSTAQNLPQGANGKVDRQKLLESRAPEAQFASAVHVASAEELLRITQGVLSNPDLAMDADLAEAGMNSLRARDLHIAILKAFGVNVPSYAVFDHFTVRALARAFLNPAGAGGVESPVLEALPSLQPKRQRSVVQGVGMCLPGGFFELHQGINCVTTVPLLRFDVDEYFSPDMEIGKTYTRHGSFIPSLGWFDSDAFPLSEHEVAAMDPQQRLALQVAAMAMGPQATGPSRGSVGVYAGQMDYDWMVSSKAPAPYGSTGVAPSITANRISFVFDLRGPSMTIDTACSASLTAAHQAMQAMNDGPGAALVVGTHVLLAPDMYLHACKAKMLSPKGRCATFDQSADGFVRGEGVASMFLVLDPDIALCQVLGTASNQNGRSAGLTKPKSDAQKVVIGEGLRRAGVDGCAVLVHELHGTGTRLGDPLEAEAVRAMLGESLVLQALKTHFGHLEGAAGIAGLMKQVALLQSLAATPNLHLYKLNDEVALAKDAKHVLEVVDLSATSPWTCAASRYVASVSSFGFGGSNAFAVLEAMQPVEAGKKAWKDLSTAAAALRSGPKKYFALIEHDVQRTKWMELKDGLCRVTAQLCTYKPSMGQARAELADNARLLAVACWPSEQQQTSLQIIERCSAFVLKTLQKAGEEPGAWRLLVAGRGQAAEACFAAAASMLRSAQGEQELRVQVVHLPASSWAEVEAALAEHSGLKLPPVSEEPVCRVRPEGVLVPRLERWRPDRQPGVSVRLGGRYVITGGSGALARVCAEWLLGRGAASVTLLSRSCPGYLEDDRRLHWLRCDVSVAGELRSAIQAIRDKGEVHGVMHAAGVLADAMLANQSKELLRRAFGPKILPALLLPELEPSDWLVMFSSAAVLGSPGQCAYAAANAAMDGLVSASDSGSGARMLSVQWGPWSEVGMAANHDLLSRVERHGFGSFTNSQGIDVLDCLLAQAAQGPLCAARVNWNAFSWPGHPVMMSHIHIRIGHPLPNLPQGAVKMKMQRPDALALLQRLATDMLGHELDPNQPLMDAGVDSLLAVELANRVSKEIGAKLPSTWLFDFPTLGSMADQLAQQAGAHVRGAAPPNLPVATPRAAMVVAGACCQLPGVSIADVLCGGRDCVVEVPTLRMDLDSWYGPEAGSAGMSYTQHAACMDGVEWFDATYFKISIPEASAMDPQQRLLLQAAACAGCEAVEKSAAVVVGQANHDWPLQNHPGTPFIGTGLSPAITSNRISFHFQLKGLSMTVDTACSSSLVALVVAQSRSDAALVGATHVMMSALPFIGSCAAGMLSQSGRCRTLDSSADGYCRGEGVAALVLQRAARDAGVTAAAVPATATNHNGHSASLTAPSGPAQQELMREALRMASAKGADVGFVELHGTGTKLGDPIEAQSTLAVFSRSEQSACLVLGAVKTNMGHLEGSAGMAGLFKLMATLRRRVAMPNLHIRQLNAHLRELNDSSFFPDALMACRAQLGAVSSFGFGGSNAQVLLQQLEADPQAARVQTPPTVCWHGRQGAFFDIPGTPSVLHTTRWQSAPCAAASVPIMLASKQVFRGMAREWSADGVRLLAMKCWDREIAEEAEGDQQQTSLQIIERCSAFVLKTLQKAGEEPGAWRLLVAGRGQAAEACFAAAASMLRSAQGEQELRVQVVHLPASSWAEVEAALAEHSDLKLPPVSDEPVCRVSPESILVPRLERWRPDRQPGVSVRLDGRYVITGGSGSLARVCAEWLLSRGATSVTLLSRSCPGYLEDDRRLHWLRCDVSVAGELRSAIQAIRDKGEVHGVMHAAGVLADAMLANQSEELLRRAFGPKILPALLLPELEPSDWLVMFSSAAVLGSPGQCAYAAANAAMDGLVSASDSGSGARMLSVQWGPWSEVGMAASQDVLGRAERHGFGAFTNRQGIDVLDHLLSHGALGCVCAARGDLAHVPSASAKAPDNRGPTPELGVLIRRLVAELTSQEETEVSVDAELVDIGLDSLGAANLSQGLSKELGVKVLPTLASEASTVRDLEQVLARELAAVPLMGDFEAATSKLPTLVVGAGVGGVIFAQQLHMARENVIVMEKGDQPGGSWHLGNSSSRLQIDSPSYMLNYEQQFNLPAYPSKEQILTEVRNAAKVLPDVRLGHRVTSVKTLQRGQYQVSFMNQLEEEQSMTVGGVAFFLGGLHHPRNVNYPGEERFTGKIGLGHKDDVDPGFFKDKEVVIVGHGAFAVENMRTALQQGAKRVTMVARRRNVVFPTVVNWLINSVHSTLSIREIRPILASFYQSVGLTLDDLPALKEDSIDFRIPPCSDIYFLAQAMGKLKVVIGEVKRVKEGAVVVQEGDTQQVIECTRLLKCIGFLHAPCVEQILGRPLEQVASFWIDGDVNLVANDQFQVPERVSSLLCPSYSFYVHSFANAFLSYRKNPQALEALSKSTNLSPHDAVTVMWQHFKAMKEKVARLTSEHLPFWRFVAQRREEWQSNAQLLNPDFQGVPNLDDLLRPASSKAAQLWPYEPQDVAGVLAPARRPRVLFFHGQKTDRLVAIELLKAQGWWQQNLDFVIPDGPHVVEADADPEQLQRVGLTQLVASKKYRPGAAYKEWPSNFQMFFDLHMGNMSKTEIERAAEAESRRYSEAFHYLKEVSTRFGPFDGVAGFCQGAAFAQVALCQQRAGHDLGLQDVRMMIAMAPWRCPYHEHLERVGQFDSKLEMPLLLMHGRQDLDMFKEAIPAFSKSFREARVVAFEGAHAYPPLARSPDLRAEVQRFLNESQRRF
ncbi:unnamed protein product [Effrenium voratum]|nr:unnamed protein product [Effrenium voratum]